MTGFKLYHVFYPNISEYPGKIEETSNECNEYKSLVYEAVSSDGAIRTDRCVNADVSSSNTENENPFLGEFPHMALIAYGNLGWFCNGVLISEEYVLTSGRCAKFSTKPKYVGFRINKDNDDDTVEVSKVIHHPEYNAPFRYNDIALMKLDRKVKLSPYIRPACLPTTHQLNSTSISTGWGTPQNHVYPFKFRKVKMDIIPEDICGKYYGQTNPYLKLGPGPPRRICVKPHREEKRTHFPDGSDGSPLQQSHNEHYCMYTVTGILITHGGEVGLPVMYTKVYSYLDWIEGIVWGNSS